MSGNAPSPWSWSDEYRTADGRPTWSLVAADGYGILSCDGEENSPQGINEPTLARLITAAPLMLKACELFAEYDAVEHDDFETMVAAYAEAIEATRAAIAAATGETK